MTQNKPLLCAAANVEVPAYLVLRQENYSVTASGSSWYAEKDGLRFQAENVVELLGVVSMVEARGDNWAATDLEIEDFLTRYCS